MFEITLSRGYSENHFRDDLKILYNKLGIENKKVVFLFTDQHVVEEGQLQEIHQIYLNVSYTLVWYVYVVYLCFCVGFLELLNNMLTSGMVPALYADDEKEQIIGQVSRNLNSVFYMIPRNFMLHHNQGFSTLILTVLTSKY